MSSQTTSGMFYNMHPYMQGLIVSVSSLGALVGALFAGSKSLACMITYFCQSVPVTIAILVYVIISRMWRIYVFIYNNDVYCLALADIVGRKLAITSGAATFAFGGAIQAGAVLIW